MHFVLPASMALLVLALGLHSRFADALCLFRRPGLLVRSLLAMNVIAPALTVCLITVLDLKPDVKIALVALSLAPVPPVLPNKQLKLVRAEGFAIGLFVATSLCAIVIVPATLELLARFGYVATHLRAAEVLRIVAMTSLVPLLLGMAVRASWPAAERWHAPLSVVATVLLVLAVLPILIRMWGPMRELTGDGTLLVILLTAVLWLAAGHALGGPRAEDRSVLALATLSRHPAVAIAVASASFPDHALAAPAVLLAFLVALAVSIPYVAWRKKRLLRADHALSDTASGAR